jgi:hypothetical protein
MGSMDSPKPLAGQCFSAFRGSCSCILLKYDQIKSVVEPAFEISDPPEENIFFPKLCPTI